MDELDKRLTTVEADLKTAFRRIDEVRDRMSTIDDLVVSVKQLAIKEENVETNVKEIRADVKALTNKPAERWNDLVKNIIGILAAAVVGYVLAKVGLK